MTASANHTGLVLLAVVMLPLMATIGDSLPVATVPVPTTASALPFLSAGIIMTVMHIFGALHPVLGLTTTLLPVESTRILMMPILPLPLAMMIRTCLQGLMDALGLPQELTTDHMTVGLTGRCMTRHFLL